MAPKSQSKHQPSSTPTTPVPTSTPSLKNAGAVRGKKTVQSILPMPLYVRFKTILDRRNWRVSGTIRGMIRQFVRENTDDD